MFFIGFKLSNVNIGIETGSIRKNKLKHHSENPILIQFHSKSLKELQEQTEYIEELGIDCILRMEELE